MFDLKKVKWSDEHGISYQTHARYLKKFGDEFYTNVKKLIDLNQDEKPFHVGLADFDKELIQEILNHYYFCQNICLKFEERPEIEMVNIKATINKKCKLTDHYLISTDLLLFKRR
jgi:hypothetical protein